MHSPPSTFRIGDKRMAAHNTAKLKLYWSTRIRKWKWIVVTNVRRIPAITCARDHVIGRQSVSDALGKYTLSAGERRQLQTSRLCTVNDDGHLLTARGLSGDERTWALMDLSILVSSPMCDAYLDCVNKITLYLFGDENWNQSDRFELLRTACHFFRLTRDFKRLSLKSWDSTYYISVCCNNHKWWIL